MKAMEEDVLIAKRHNGTVMVSLHVHDVSHSRAYGIQDTTPPNEEIPFRRAIDAGADAVLGSGPHVLRGIELRERQADLLQPQQLHLPVPDPEGRSRPTSPTSATPRWRGRRTSPSGTGATPAR